MQGDRAAAVALPGYGGPRKSAAVIVGVGRLHPVVWRLETSPDEGRTHPTEGPNAMKDVSLHEPLSALNLYR